MTIGVLVPDVSRHLTFAFRQSYEVKYDESLLLVRAAAIVIAALGMAALSKSDNLSKRYFRRPACGSKSRRVTKCTICR